MIIEQAHVSAKLAKGFLKANKVVGTSDTAIHVALDMQVPSLVQHIITRSRGPGGGPHSGLESIRWVACVWNVLGEHPAPLSDSACAGC